MLVVVAAATGCTRSGGERAAARVSDAAATTTPTTADDDPTTTGPTTTPGTTAPPAPADADDPQAHAALGDWIGCAGSFECTTLSVPEDWSEPEGARIDLLVTRHRATGDRIGSLMLNPGGPGAPGTGFLQSFVESGLPDGLAERFDLVSWDPRGTAGDTEIDCTTDAEWLEPDLDPTPDDQADIDAIRAQAEAGVEQCTTAYGDLLAQVGTRATVRDLDALRGLLGDELLTYVGYSYGTTIGMEYLRLFPDRARAIVLDGVAPPGVDPVEDTRAQAQGFERTLDAFLTDCADRSTCPLDDDDPKGELIGLVEQLEDEPVDGSYELNAPDAEPREGTVGPGELYIAVAAALYDTSSWEILDQGLTELMDDPANGRTILALRDQYLGREADGTWADDSDARSAIRCADQAERSAEPEGDLTLVDDWAAELPFWGAWFATGLPGCWGSPDAVEPLLPLGDGDLEPSAPVVVLGTTNDPATPFEQAEDAARIIEGSVLVTFEGDVHTAYRGLSSCVDDAITAYLVDLTVPPAGLTC